MQKKPPLPLTAFIGGPTLIRASQSATSSSSSSSLGSGMCFPSSKSGSGGGGGASGGGSSGEKQRDRHGGGGGLCGCHKAPKSHCISATGKCKRERDEGRKPGERYEEDIEMDRPKQSKREQKRER